MSWFGPTFHGRLTANGEVYDLESLNADHATMPLPSYARVTNPNNGTSIVLRVNGRGNNNRIIDVSKRTLEMLGYRNSGTAKMRFEYLGKGRMGGLDF